MTRMAYQAQNIIAQPVKSVVSVVPLTPHDEGQKERGGSLSYASTPLMQRCSQ